MAFTNQLSSRFRRVANALCVALPLLGVAACTNVPSQNTPTSGAPTANAQIFTRSPTGGRVAAYPATDGAYGRPATVVVSDENNNTLRVHTLQRDLRLQGYDQTRQYLLDIRVSAQCPSPLVINPSLPQGIIGTLNDLAHGGRPLPVQAANPEALQLIAQAKLEIEAANRALAARSIVVANGQVGNSCGERFHYFLNPGQTPIVQINAGVGNNIMALYQADHMWLRADYSERDVKIYPAILSAQPNGRPVINVFPIGTDNLNFSTLRQSMLRAVRSQSMQSLVPLSIPQQQIIADAYTAAIITAMNGIGQTARDYQSRRATDSVRRLFRGDQFSPAPIPFQLQNDPFALMRGDAVLGQYLPNPQMLVVPQLAPVTPLPQPPRRQPPAVAPAPATPQAPALPRGGNQIMAMNGIALNAGPNYR